MHPEQITFLLVEDDDVDAEAIERALSQLGLKNTVRRAHDGVEALEFLRGTDKAEPLPYPHLVLLDLNLPRMNGYEFLEALRADPILTRTLIFVLTTSDDEQDKLRAYSHHIAGYLVKPRLSEELRHLTQMLDDYWRSIEFPPEAQK